MIFFIDLVMVVFFGTLLLAKDMDPISEVICIVAFATVVNCTVQDIRDRVRVKKAMRAWRRK